MIYAERGRVLLVFISLIAFDQITKAIFLFQKNESFINDSSGLFFLFPPKLKALLIIFLLFFLGRKLWKVVSSNIGIDDSKDVNKEEKVRNTLTFPILLIIAGGLSNLLDYPMYKGVLDIFTIKSLYFNAADLYILTGCIWVIGYTCVKK
jgi:lipoprotein signal peptidase